MTYIKTKINNFLNEYNSPILISKEDLGLGIKKGDKLTINSKIYYFNFIDKNIIHVDDIDGNDTFFKLDDLNRSWHISAINNQEIIVENLNESNITFDKIFITTNVDTEIENLDKVVPYESYLINYDRDLKSTITWQLDPDMNNECIKSMGLSISNITASIEWTVDDGEKSDEGVIEFNESSNGEWYFESNVEFSKDGSVCPSLIEINFDTKKIIVS